MTGWRAVMAAALAALTLAGCGADGVPNRPGTSTPGLDLSGDARFGLSR